MQFTGSNYLIVDTANASSSLSFDTDTFSIEAWINPNVLVNSTNNYEHTIIGKDSIPINGSGYVLRTGGSGKLEFSFNSGNAWKNITTYNSVIEVNKWSHVAVTKYGANIKLYVNGFIVRDTTLASNHNIVTNNRRVRIGENGSFNSRRFYGKIEELKIWHEARTATQIFDDMVETCAPYPSNLLAYYKFNDDTTINAYTAVCSNNTILNAISNQVLNLTDSKILNAASTILYVDSSNVNTGCNANTGNSWATAFADLNDAIFVAQNDPNVDKIYVAQGTYIPKYFPFEMQSNKIGIQKLNVREFTTTQILGVVLY